MEKEETPQITPSADMTSAKRTEKSPMMQFVAGIVVILVVVLVSAYIYTKAQVRNLSESPFVLRASETFRVPIAKIKGNSVLYAEFMTDYRSLKRFYENQPDGTPIPSDTEIQEQVLSRLMINELIADLASSYNIRISDEDMSQARSELLSQFPDEETATTEINNTFGWSLDTFANRVIGPIVTERKVSEAFATDESVETKYKANQVKGSHILFVSNSDSDSEATKANAEAVLQRIKDGEDFATLAKEFGADGTAEVGGDLGWIDRGMTVPSFEDVLFSLHAGQLHDSVVETEFGFHIVRADEIRTVNDFPAYFQDLLSGARVKIFTDLANPFDTTAQDANMEVGDGAGTIGATEDSGSEPNTGAELAQ